MYGKYQAYSEYKETDSEWMDRVPIDWDVLPLKFVTSSKVKDGPHETPKFIDEGIPFFSVDGIQEHQLIFEGCRFISRDDHERFSLKCRPKKGDVLLGKAASVGKVAYVDTDNEFNVWSPLAVITPKCQETGRFIFYSLQSALLQVQCDVLSNSNTQKNLSMQTIDNLIFSFPAANVANQIANFLDHETAKIDTLIEKQQQLIKLLKEKRQAVISHAVTKGLNPSAPMRDSGVEWLGEVPEYWKIVPVKHISKICYGIGEPPKYQEEGIPLIRATNIRSGKISEVGLVLVNPNDIPENRIVWLDVGDIIVVRSGAGTGDSSIIPKDYQGSIAGFDMVVRPTKCLPEFLGHVLLSNYVRNNQIDLEKTRAAQPHLNAEELGECFVLLPSNEEQRLIVDYIDREILKFDDLVIKAKTAIVLMQERRTTLISAAVTGKIDVRKWQSPEPSNNKTNKEVAA